MIVGNRGMKASGKSGRWQCRSIPRWVDTGAAAAPVQAALQQVEVGEDALGGLAAFPYGGHHQIGTAHYVVVGVDFGVGGLEGVRLPLGDDATARIDRDLVLFEPRLRIGAEAEGDEYAVGRYDFLGARSHHRGA